MNKQDNDMIENSFEAKVLIGLQNGIPIRRMSDNFKISREQICKIRDNYINSGVISKEEIDNAHKKYMSLHPASQGLNGKRKGKKAKSKKEDQRSERTKDNMQRVINMVKSGEKSISQMVEELRVSYSTVRKYIKKLKDDKILSQEDIERIPVLDIKPSIDKTNSDYINERNKVESYLRQGWENFAICKALNITHTILNMYIEDIIKKGIMSLSDIEEARQRKYQTDLDLLEEHVSFGYTISDFRKLKPEYSYNGIAPLINDLINQRRITREQIDINAKNAYKRSVRNRNKSKITYVLNKMNKGFTPKDIFASSDNIFNLTINEIEYLRRVIIESGLIKKDKVVELIKKRKAKENEKKLLLLKTLIIQGNTDCEIALEMNYTVKSILKFKRIALKKGILTQEDIQRGIEEREKKKEKIEVDSKMSNNEVDSNIPNNWGNIDSIRNKADEENSRELNATGFKSKEISVPTDNRKELICYAIERYNNGNVIDDNDISIILGAIESHDELISPALIKLLIFNNIRNGKIDSAIERVYFLKNIIKNKDYFQLLEKYIDYIKLYQVKLLNGKGLSNENIGKELSLTSAEVAVYLMNDDSTEFFDI